MPAGMVAAKSQPDAYASYLGCCGPPLGYCGLASSPSMPEGLFSFQGRKASCSCKEVLLASLCRAWASLHWQGHSGSFQKLWQERIGGRTGLLTLCKGADDALHPVVRELMMPCVQHRAWHSVQATLWMCPCRVPRWPSKLTDPPISLAPTPSVS